MDRKRMMQDLLSRREALHRLGGFSFAAAGVLTGASMLLPGCGGGGGGSWSNSNPSGGDPDGSSMAKAWEMPMGYYATLDLTSGTWPEEWFKAICEASGDTEAVVEVFSLDPDSSIAVRTYNDSGQAGAAMSPCTQGDTTTLSLQCSADDFGYIKFELLPGFSGASIKFNLWNSQDPSWSNAWNDWSDSPWNDWSDSPWSDHWSDWYNAPWGNWMQSW